MGNNTPLYDIYSSFESPDDHITKERESEEKSRKRERDLD
jgi:hypothetical protein